MLDTHNVIRARLFREACVQHEGSFVKDMSMIGRNPTDTIIVDNSPASYLFQPENALPCESFIDDPQDRELYALADMLETIQSVVDVREALQRWTSGACGGSGRAVFGVWLNFAPPPSHCCTTTPFPIRLQARTMAWQTSPCCRNTRARCWKKRRRLTRGSRRP